MRRPSRSNYWGNSKFAQWLYSLVGITQLECGTSEEWVNWKKDSKKKSPFMFWFVESFIDKLQDFCSFPTDALWNLRCAINARFFDRYHYLPTKLNPWEYHEVDSRMLHGLFETLVNFIEIEKAWMNVVCGDEGNKFGYKWYETNRWTRIFFECRKPEAGLAYLNWEMSLKTDDSWYGHCEEHIQKAKESGEYGSPTHQAISAKEQYELYNWWKNVRPNRPDPHEASGFDAYFERRRAECGDDDFFSLLSNKSDEDRKESKACSDRLREIEEAYDKEDEEMMIRLIKIRRHLWT